jgi:tRNA modification GTPase
MKHPNQTAGDTIVALSTPPGRSGIGVVRLSGPDVMSILKKIFISKGNSEFSDRRAIYGSVTDPQTGQVLDDGLVTVMRGPRSYTGEDVAELSLHGSPLVLDMVVRLIILHGGRLAVRGEFTRRAFLAGKLDLIQAEAVIELIEAKTGAAATEARRLMDKGPTVAVCEISDALKDILAEIEAHIDFDEDEESGPPETGPAIREVLAKIETMKRKAEASRIRRDGISTVITGKPNVGKSTLFNALLKNERTIVTPYPGTTRDPVDDCILLGGKVLVLWDTAGIRNDPDPVEEEGIRRTREIIDHADLVIAVLDASEPTDEEDVKVLDCCKGKKTVLVFNKVDLVREEKFRATALGEATASHVAVSAKTGQGMDALERMLDDLAEQMMAQGLMAEGPGLNSRCSQLIDTATVHIERVISRLNRRESIPPEILSYELRCALGPLEEITGERANEGVLDRIFDRFCVGK